MTSPDVALQAKRMLEGSPADAFTRTLLDRFDEPVADYIASLFEYRAAVPMEDALARAWQTELMRVGVRAMEAGAIVERLKARRTLQTIAHTTLTNGPGFLGANWLASLGQRAEEPCIVATFSGIPFDNECRPGCLNFGMDLPLRLFVDPECPMKHALRSAEKQRERDTQERRHSLVPERCSRSAVYASPVTDHTRTIAAFLAEPVAQFFPAEIGEGDFTALALTVAAGIDSAILGRRMVYVDLNAIIADYLAAVLDDAHHPVSRLLFDTESLETIEAQLAPLSLFSRSGRNGARFALYSREGRRLCSREDSIAFDPLSIQAGLRDRALCPGLFLAYFALAFLNGFQCLGGFNQVRYLPRFRDALAKLSTFRDHPMRLTPTNALTLGRARDEESRPVYPIDALFGRMPVFDPQLRFGEFAAPTVLRGQWRARPADPSR